MCSEFTKQKQNLKFEKKYILQYFVCRRQQKIWGGAETKAWEIIYWESVNKKKATLAILM